MTSDVDRIRRLTDAQREVLRRFRTRKSAKEIAREIGISHFAVNERLRAARRVLGVATSIEAARLLEELEDYADYKRVVCDPPPLAPDGAPPAFPRREERVGAPWEVREERAPYRLARGDRQRWPLPSWPGEPNRLSARARLMWIGAIAVGLAAALGALVSIAWGIVRIVGHLLRAAG
ncbi:hypothetical protein [Allosphingosinicella indica]|uniref:Regulatory protein, luxR family n=1 Tax=Allosphingosinicella indica TaxID=941907 RepID=A0A1X7FYG4_9SPHN|nr:hypothetical protein [Allosphingosinicella indica]SMF61059.1 regulatory protein, luxR family [Allosphingosinicella indica]